MLNAAVLGSPIGHSLSPVLHRAAYAALGLDDWRYAVHEIRADELAGFVTGLDDSWRGLSLTMPLKEVAFDVAEDVSDVAARSGSVNTLVRRPKGGWDGHNTDVRGMVAALAGVEHSGVATVLGGGATARSALLALAELGVTRVRLAVRNIARAAGVERAAEGMALDVVHLADWPIAGDALVVSTLPPEGSQVAAAALGGRDRIDGTLLDVVYADWPTPLARAAADHAMSVVSGLDMLVNQAAGQVELMTGRRPPVEAMFAAVRREGLS